ncbi:hypothetical protein ACMV5I_26615 [Serratia sp. T13T92]|uniref:hypothetical protein n=1 Tax=Serratia sp. T13T92 TaxID=3397496 RepID=UPI0039E0273A
MINRVGNDCYIDAWTLIKDMSAHYSCSTEEAAALLLRMDASTGENNGPAGVIFYEYDVAGGLNRNPDCKINSSGLEIGQENVDRLFDAILQETIERASNCFQQRCFVVLDDISNGAFTNPVTGLRDGLQKVIRACGGGLFLPFGFSLNEMSRLFESLGYELPKCLTVSKPPKRESKKPVYVIRHLLATHPEYKDIADKPYAIAKKMCEQIGTHSPTGQTITDWLQNAG